MVGRWVSGSGVPSLSKLVDHFEAFGVIIMRIPHCQIQVPS